MITAAISGDIVAYTSLGDKGRAFIDKAFSDLVDDLIRRYGIYARVIKGDALECVVPEPEKSLRIALIVKSFLKSVSNNNIFNHITDKRFKFFKMHGIRLAIGYGELSRFDPEKGIIDGQAIYFSGRKINEETTYRKERIVIKNTLYFESADEKLNKEFEPLLALIDVLMSKATAKQCEVLYLKLMDYNEEAIAARMKIAQPVVNQHSTSTGWNAIEKAVNHFTDLLKNNKP